MVEKIMEDLNLIPFNLNNEHNFCSFSLHNLQRKKQNFHKNWTPCTFGEMKFLFWINKNQHGRHFNGQ